TSTLRPGLIKELFSIQLFDQAALFNLSKKTRIDEVRRGEVFDLRIGLALEHRLQRLVVGRWQSFQQIGLLVVKVGSFLRAQAAKIFLQQRNRTGAIALEKMDCLDKGAGQPLDGG